MIAEAIGSLLERQIKEKATAVTHERSARGVKQDMAKEKEAT